VNIIFRKFLLRVVLGKAGTKYIQSNLNRGYQLDFYQTPFLLLTTRIDLREKGGSVLDSCSRQLLAVTCSRFTPSGVYKFSYEGPEIYQIRLRRADRIAHREGL
jgi:hypothetical protein